MGPHVAPPGMALTSWLFLRLLGFVYLAAFVSLWTQIIGLAGRDGILPAREFLADVGSRVGWMRYVYVPTLCWFNASDGFLNVLSAIGTVSSLLLALGIAPAVAAAGAWVCYLSLTTVGQDFLWFQWDSLLLETGFIAIFLAPWRAWSRPGADAPPRPALWLAALAAVPAHAVVGRGQADERRSDVAESDRAHVPLRDAAAPAVDRVVCASLAGVVPGRVDRVPVRRRGAGAVPRSSPRAASDSPAPRR